MGSKPGRDAMRTTGDKRAPGQEQAAGSIGPTREIRKEARSERDEKLSEPPREGKDEDSR